MEKEKEIDWEQRRYEISKSVLQGMIMHSGSYDNIDYISDTINSSVIYTDMLINKLKNRKKMTKENI